MTELVRAFALLSLLATLAGGCSLRSLGSSSSATVKPVDLYAAGPTAADANSILGGANWWTAAPTFQIKPLDDANYPPAVLYLLIRRFENLGTTEIWRIRYFQFDNSTDATAAMTANQSQFTATVTGKKVGDQVLYVQTKVGSSVDSGAPYEGLAIIRVGSVMIESILLKSDGFPSSDRQGKVADKLATGVSKALAGKVHGTSLSATELGTLPPPNQYITLLGSARLPIEAWPLMLGLATPTTLVDAFKADQMNEFVFGDYVLDSDTHMEVQAAVLAFPSAARASQLFNAFKATSSVDANGVLALYDDALGQYQYLVVAGARVGVLICKSTAELQAPEAASRACERPLETVAGAWPAAFSG